MSSNRNKNQSFCKPFGLSNSNLFLTLLALLIFSGCGKSPEPRKRQGTLDTPAHHALRGQDLLKQKRWNAAEKQFDSALELNPEFAPALSGKALVKAHQSSQPGRKAERVEALREESRDLLKESLNHAESPEHQIRVRIDAVQVETQLKEDDWLEQAGDHYGEALELVEDQPALRKRLPELNFYMGEAYLAARAFADASGHYARVLELNQSFTREADRQQTLVQKIVRAQPGSPYAKEVALVAEISRADLSAMLIEEFQLENLYLRGAKVDASGKKFKSPVKKFKTSQTLKMAEATDIEDHPLRADIELVLQLKVRGLEANPQHLFFPNRRITRAEYALMLEDILIKVTQDKGLSTKFLGDRSPWSDVRSDAYYYNAARTLTSRGILDVRNAVRGEFGPDDPVHGSDVLLSLRLLKDELKSYVRGS